MAYQEYEVQIPDELFDRALETGEPQLWTDDRGFTYEVRLAYTSSVSFTESGEPVAQSSREAFAHCVGRPGIGDVNEAWYRDDPAPETSR